MAVKTLRRAAAGGYEIEHEHQIIGVIAGTKNTIKLTTTDESGAKTQNTHPQLHSAGTSR